MFTGIIQFMARISGTSPKSGGRVIRVSMPDVWSDVWGDLPSLGESISIDGACLTVESASSSELTFFASDETCEKTTLGLKRVGEFVNCERAATLNSQLGGHLVSGHVDGRGVVESVVQMGDGWRLTFSVPKNLARYIIEKGSVCIDGVSLTSVDVSGNRFNVWVIPHTWKETSLQFRAPGTEINVECDMIAKMVEKLLMPLAGKEESGTDLIDLLKKAGFKQ
jgi:riboflavin synthase